MGSPNHNMNSLNGNQYKPIPPPKPKNYKPPHTQSYGRGDGMVQPPSIYQHGKSHSNPVVSIILLYYRNTSVEFNKQKVVL